MKLQLVKLQLVKLQLVKLQAVKLQFVKLQLMQLQPVKLKPAKLQLVNLQFVKLQLVRCQAVTLQLVKLQLVKLQRVKLQPVNVRGYLPTAQGLCTSRMPMVCLRQQNSTLLRNLPPTFVERMVPTKHNSNDCKLLIQCILLFAIHARSTCALHAISKNKRPNI